MALTWFSLLPFYKEEYAHIYGSMFVALILLVTSYIVFKRIGYKEKAILPEGRFFSRDLYEVIIENTLAFMAELMGEERAKHFLPFIGTLFILILLSNLLGLIPGFDPPTANINTNTAYALVVFFATHYYGFKEHGVGYLKHFMGPVWWLAVLIVPLEIISHLFRPVTLSLRLFGNMNGDHLALSIFSDLIPLGVPVIFLGLGLLVSFIQAFIFALLAVLYISAAIEH